MNVLFISYWGYNDGLSVATVLPHVKVLNSIPKVRKVFLITIERDKPLLPQFNEHIPLSSGHAFWDKVKDLWEFPKKIINVIHGEKIDFVICRSSLAGTLGYLACKKTGTPFSVESYEPHADYMAESKVWNKIGLKYGIQKFFESRQQKHANYLLPLSQKYASDLLEMGVPENRLIVFPCTVNEPKFKFKEEDRKRVRKNLDVPSDSIVGIYVGKKGGIYYENEIFFCFKAIANYVPNICFLILTPQDHQDWETKFNKFGIKNSNYKLNSVTSSDVPAYLSSADFAFNFHKTTKISHALSPIKNSEYLANGLPIIMGKNIGDQSQLIESNGNGKIVDFENREAMEKMNWSFLYEYQGRFNKDSYSLPNEFLDKNIKAIYSRLLQGI